MPATTKKVTKPTAKRATKTATKPARKGTRSLSTAEAVRKAAKATGPAAVAPLADALAAMGVPAKVAVGLAKAGKAGKVAPTKAAKPAAKLSPIAEGFLDSFADGVTAAKARGEKPTPLGLKAIVEKARADAKPAKADAKARKAPVRMVSGGESVVGGAKGKIIAMIAAKGGTSAAEVCKALGWARAGATIGRAIKLATFKVRKERDADGVLRYYAA